MGRNFGHRAGAKRYRGALRQARKPGRKWPTCTAGTQFIGRDIGRMGEQQLGLGSALGLVVPNTRSKHRALGRFHARPRTPNPRFHDFERTTYSAPILFPPNLLDGVRPGQSERFSRQGRHQGTRSQAQSHQPAPRRTRRLRQKCQAITAAPSAKPISSVTGRATTMKPAAAAARMRSGQVMRVRK